MTAQQIAIGQHDRYGAQRHRTSAGSDRLLPDQAAAQRNLLVDDAAAIAADPDRGENVVRSGECLGHVSRQRHHPWLAEHSGDLDGKPGGRRPPGRVRLEQTYLVERTWPAGQHGAHERGHPHPAAAKHRQLHHTIPVCACPVCAGPICVSYLGAPGRRTLASTATSLTTIGRNGQPAPVPSVPTSPTPPSRLTALDPAALAATAASVTEAPPIRAAIMAPAKLSPAPV